MPFTRRSFLDQQLKLCSGAFLLPSLDTVDRQYSLTEPFKEDWDYVRSLFPITQWSKVHFNSGSAGVMPLPVLDHLIELMRQMNRVAPYEAWSGWHSVRMRNLERLAQCLNTSPEELQVVRNTTEALNMIIYGLPLKVGDEVIIAEHDYPFAINAYNNRSLRDGIKVTKISCPIPAGHDEVVECYRASLSEATRVVHLTYMTHREGHIMPVKEIIDLCHERGIQLVLDGAHTLAQIDVDLRDIQADYYATSLHKWLNAPHGTGLIFVRKDLISSLYNHPSSYPDAAESINKFEHIGTRAFYNEIGISAALDFHEWIGFNNKKDRLRKLNRYWMSRITDIPGVSMHTTIHPDYSCAVGAFSIDGLGGTQIAKILEEDHGIHAKSVGLYQGSGVRISVNVFTSFDELDRLVAAIESIAG